MAKEKHSGWWGANCGETFESRCHHRVVVMQMENFEEDRREFRVHSRPQGEVDIVTAALTVATNPQDKE